MPSCLIDFVAIPSLTIVYATRPSCSSVLIVAIANQYTLAGSSVASIVAYVHPLAVNNISEVWPMRMPPPSFSEPSE